MTPSFPDLHLPELLSVLGGFSVRPLPTMELLQTIVALAHYASLEREENRQVQFSLALLGRGDLEFQRQNAWTPALFEAPRDATVDEIAKLAPSFDPRHVWIAMVFEDGKLQIRGFVRTDLNIYRMDRGSQIQAGSVSRDFLRITALAPGTLEIASHHTVIATFAKGTFVRRIAAPIGPTGILLDMWRARAPRLGAPDYRDPAAEYGLIVLRLLEKTAALGCGGTIVILPDEKTDSDIDLKYSIGGSYFRDSLERYLRRRYELLALDADMDAATTRAHASGCAEDLEAARAATARHSNMGAVASLESTQFEDALGTVARLTAVDGALVLRGDLSVLGFGGMFQWDKEDVPVRHTSDDDGRQYEEWDMSRHGSRHRSAAWYCHRHPGAVAFVVSEDGPISCMVQLSDRPYVLLWRPVQLTWGIPFRNMARQLRP